MSASEGGVSKPAQVGPDDGPEYEPTDGLGFDTALRAYSPRGRWAARLLTPRPVGCAPTHPAACGLRPYSPLGLWAAPTPPAAACVLHQPAAAACVLRQPAAAVERPGAAG